MPSGIDLYIPFPSRISADADAADARHLAWPCSFGLLDTAAARRRHAAARYAELAARFQPHASGVALDLCVDQMSWYFIFDDYFDGPGSAPGSAREQVAATAAVLDHPPGPDAAPMVLAFADLWRRSREGMSPSWRARAARHWRAYLDGYVVEADNRARGRRFHVPDYLRLRALTIGGQPVLDLVERIGRFEVPSRAFTSAHLTTTRRTILELITIQNDIWSLEKEEAIGDLHNIVLILERERECTRSRAVDLAADLIRQRSEDYLALERALPDLYAALGLDRAERVALERYATDGMRNLARGNYDWSERTGRYATEVFS
jgi:pentalenene synthase